MRISWGSIRLIALATIVASLAWGSEREVWATDTDGDWCKEDSGNYCVYQDANGWTHSLGGKSCKAGAVDCATCPSDPILRCQIWNADVAYHRTLSQ